MLFSEPWFYNMLKALAGVSGVVVIAGMVVWMLGASVFEEIGAAIGEQQKRKQPLSCKGQRPAVRHSVARLASPRRWVRLEGLELLREFNDPSCVPSLVRAIDLWQDDVPFLIEVVQLMAQLGDARALPALHHLARNRHPALMQAAQQAISQIEPRTVLLRAGSAPMSGGELLRAAIPAVNAAGSSDMLLRASCGE